MQLYHSTDSDGVTILNPDLETMRRLLSELDEPGADEAEHPDVSLVHDPSGWSISVYPSGVVTLENLNNRDATPDYLQSVPREDALQLWQELSRGEIDLVRGRHWIRGEA